MYATKRRRRYTKQDVDLSVKSRKRSASTGHVVRSNANQSNPSKRHRDRLNAEIEQLAILLPFDADVIGRLDKLSVLRLAVSFLRIESYFAALPDFHRSDVDNFFNSRLRQHRFTGNHHVRLFGADVADTNHLLQVIGGFLFVVTADLQVFFVSHSVEQYIGFHQSDIIHQNALELIHSEDRETFKSQFRGMTSDQPSGATKDDGRWRCFNIRFRCLLQDASGFVTMAVSGSLKPLQGQSSADKARFLGSQPPALFATCCPLGQLPQSSLDGASLCSQDDVVFQTKHKLDMSIISMDQRARKLLECGNQYKYERRGYDLIHPDDLHYYAIGHTELLRKGRVGLVAYRLLTADQSSIWVQTSARVILTNSRQDFVLSTHRCISEYEGSQLIRKRDGEYKLPYPLVSPLGENDPDFRFQSSPDFRVESACHTSSIFVDSLSTEWRHLNGEYERLCNSSVTSTTNNCHSIDHVPQVQLNSHKHRNFDEHRIQTDGEKNRFSSDAVDTDVRSMALQRLSAVPNCQVDTPSGSPQCQPLQSFGGSFVALLNNVDDTLLHHVDAFSTTASDFCCESSSSPNDILSKCSSLTPPCDGDHCDAAPKIAGYQLYDHRRKWNCHATDAARQFGDRSDSTVLNEWTTWTPLRECVQDKPRSIDGEETVIDAPDGRLWTSSRSVALPSTVMNGTPELGWSVINSGKSIKPTPSPPIEYSSRNRAMQSWYLPAAGSETYSPMSFLWNANCQSKPFVSHSQHQRAFIAAGYYGYN